MKELGELIRGARVQREITLEQAAADTRIQRQYLDAIEDGDFRIFPGSAYASGFLRNYASYLGLSPDEILQTYHALAPAPAISITPATTVGAERLRRRSRRRIAWVFVALALVFLSAAAIKKYGSQQGNGPGAAAGSLPVSTSGLTTPSGALRHHRSSARYRYHGGSRGGRHHGSGTWHPAGQTGPVLRAAPAIVGLRADHATWVHVMVNHLPVYWGPVQRGQYRQWSGQVVTIRTHHGNHLTMTVNGKPIGLLSTNPGGAGLTATATRWQRSP